MVTRRELFGISAAAVAANAQTQTQTQQVIEPTPPARLLVRIEDERGRPTAARIYIRTPGRVFHVPTRTLGREIARSRETFFHAKGFFPIEVPAGECTVEAVKGFEYVPVVQQVRTAPSQILELKLVLKRWIDMPSKGWHSGDVHMHPNHVHYGTYMTMADCQLYAQAEDIRVASLLISSAQSGHVFDTEYFRGGRPDPLSTPEALLVVQEEYRNTSAMYGHMPLLGISKLVDPFFTGEPATEHWEDYPPNYWAAKAAKDQGGVVCYTHPAQAPGVTVGPHLAREFPVDLALGVVDAMDLLGNGNEEGACWMYYKVLNCGLRCAASSGSDSRMDVMRHAVSGGGKVYVQVSGELTYPKWLAAYKAGRTFVSNGPILSLDMEGSGPGDTFRVEGSREIMCKARAESYVPMGRLELIVNGQVAGAAEATGDKRQLELSQSIQLDKSSWIAARVTGGSHRLVVNDPAVFAHTSPVYCLVGNGKIRSAEDAKAVVEWIDRLMDDVRKSPRFATADRREEVLSLFRKGRAYYAEQVE
ncbi:MAG: CehA/McbA family metallohydrolase [Bryobacterales bacterium]|nr:CehA/McbA family metallohydrolase [Bryobacterales bacterium]